MKRRISLLASGAVVMVPLALSACGSNNGTTPAPTPTPTTATSTLFQDQFGQQTSTLFQFNNTAEAQVVSNATVPALDPTIEPKDN